MHKLEIAVFNEEKYTRPIKNYSIKCCCKFYDYLIQVIKSL